MRWLPFVLLCCAGLFGSGCQPKPSPAPATAESEESAVAAAENTLSAEASTATPRDNPVGQEPVPQEPMDYGRWLPLPESLEGRLADAYPMFVRSANAGDANGTVNLAVVSQQIGATLARQDQPTEAYAFYVQAGEAMRAGLQAGVVEVPQQLVVQIYYHEACAHSRTGNVEESLVAIEAAIDQGFTNLELLKSDEDLQSVREQPGFEQQLESWQGLIAEKARERALEDLANGESFPFTFSATDIDGNEQSLAALQGKVVIVDVWGTWCPPCRAEIPSFIKLQDKFGSQGFQMIGLNYERKETPEENLAAVQDFIKEFGINYPCILGDEKTRQQIPGFRGYPTTLFIDRSGSVRMTAVGMHDYPYLEAIVAELLKQE